MSTEIDCRACGEEVNTRRDHCPACWWRAHKRVPELEEWVKIYRILRDAHKNHRRQLQSTNAKLVQAVNDKDLELFESQELVAALLEALNEVAYSSYHYIDSTAELKRRIDVAQEAIRKARTT